MPSNTKYAIRQNSKLWYSVYEVRPLLWGLLVRERTLKSMCDSAEDAEDWLKGYLNSRHYDAQGNRIG